MDVIVTERLRLRRAREDDIEAMHAVLSDPRAMLYWSTLPHRTLDETRDWLASMMDESPALRDDFVVEHEGRVVGKAGCWRVPEIGYILHPDVWGRGLAREALEALIPRLFARFDIPAITADVDPCNLASIGLLERLGFVETGRARGTWEIGGQLHDSIYFALGREASRGTSRAEAEEKPWATS
jgi:RimJ/RimL family protein N-acetyltransferase